MSAENPPTTNVNLKDEHIAGTTKKKGASNVTSPKSTISKRLSKKE